MLCAVFCFFVEFQLRIAGAKLSQKNQMQYFKLKNLILISQKYTNIHFKKPPVPVLYLPNILNFTKLI